MKAIDRIYVAILLTVFGGIVLHAPLSVWLGTLWPDYVLLIKSWKELLLGAALLIGLYIIARRRAWAQFNSPLFWIIGGFTALHLLLIPVFYTGFNQTVAGLLIDLRYLLFFTLVFVALRLYPQLYKPFLRVFLAGALVVVVFAVLQVTVLPHDFLSHIGYDETTIMPYLTVDQNMNYIRISSTLRGPNPLGAYAVIVLTMTLALWVGKNEPAKRLTKTQIWLVAILGVGGVVALWASYSRSAGLAMVVALVVLLLVIFGRYRSQLNRISRVTWIAIGVVILSLGVGLYVVKDTPFVSQVILHEDPTGDAGLDVNSNDGHLSSLTDGSERVLSQPLGAGIGSTGSASLLGDSPLIIENQYLFVAHESGWLGLGLFVAIYWLVLRQLWRQHKRWFGLGVFASGLGMALIGLLLPVFVDDTVSIIWWGLAAMALGMAVKHE